MRLKGRDIDAFLATPRTDISFVLVYGPDEGLVRERAQHLVQFYLKDSTDPFALLDLSEDEYRADPARLSDEFSAISMFGGMRAIRLRLKTDRSGRQIKSLIEDLDSGAITGDAVIIVEAGDLKPSSATRKSAESAKRAAALPCYRDDDASLKRLVSDMLSQESIQYTNETLDLMVSMLGNDRAITRQELQKIILFKHGDDDSILREEDIRQCMASANELGLQDVAYATADGDTRRLAQSLDRCALQSDTPVAILRSLSRHMEQLHMVQCTVENGASRTQAVDQLRPRLHFKLRPKFERQLRYWTRRRCEQALSLLYTAELDCKTTGLPNQSICAQTAFRLARAAQRTLRQ